MKRNRHRKSGKVIGKTLTGAVCALALLLALILGGCEAKLGEGNYPMLKWV